MGNVQFEHFQDLCYFDMWAVRPVGSKDFNDPQLVHFPTEELALKFKEIAQQGTWAVEPKKEVKDEHSIS